MKPISIFGTTNLHARCHEGYCELPVVAAADVAAAVAVHCESSVLFALVLVQVQSVRVKVTNEINTNQDILYQSSAA